jgi:uncharacterized protein YnzC (UPF0291/DUF896 family)
MDKMYIVVESLDDKKIQYAKTPKIKIISDNEIRIMNQVLNDKLESFKDEMTVVLENGRVVDTFQRDVTGKYFIAEILDLKADNQYIFETMQDYLDVVNFNRKSYNTDYEKRCSH